MSPQPHHDKYWTEMAVFAYTVTRILNLDYKSVSNPTLNMIKQELT